MKRVLIGLGIVVVLVIAYWLISPLFIETRVNEPLSDIPGMPSELEHETDASGEVNDVIGDQYAPEDALELETEEPTTTTLATGTFEGRAGHSAEGAATLLQVGGDYYVRFENDFQVTNGPDLFVYFGKDDAYESGARIGRLKGSAGGQNYKVPSDIDPTQFNEVWVWCRAFATPFGVAQLN